jgi:predicted RNase H-like nuclease (RuvC/YqgF family)
MTDQELKEIRDDLSFITEGKWFRYNDETKWVAAWDKEKECDTPVCECHELEDAMFIEKVPEYVRKLLEDNERLRKENEMLHQEAGSEFTSWFGRQARKLMQDIDKFDKEFEETERYIDEQHKEMEENRKRFKERWKQFGR